MPLLRHAATPLASSLQPHPPPFFLALYARGSSGSGGAWYHVYPPAQEPPPQWRRRRPPHQQQQKKFFHATSRLRDEQIDNAQNHYETLKLEPGATPADIKKCVLFAQLVI